MTNSEKNQSSNNKDKGYSKHTLFQDSIDDQSVDSFFGRNEYWPFMIGVFIIGGFIVLPFVWIFILFPDFLLLKMPYFKVVVFSLIASTAFFIGFRRNGTFSFGRAVPAFFISFIGAFYYLIKTGKATIIIGVGGYLILGGCGFISIWIWKFFRGKYK